MKIINLNVLLFAALFATHAHAKWPFYFWGPVLQDGSTIMEENLRGLRLSTQSEVERRLCSLERTQCKLNLNGIPVTEPAHQKKSFVLTELYDTPNSNGKLVGFWVQFYIDTDRAERLDIPIYTNEWQYSFIFTKDGKRIPVRESFYKYGSLRYLSENHKLLLPYWQIEDVEPKIFDGKNRTYWLKLFSSDGASYWMTKNTWVFSPQYAYLNYQKSFMDGDKVSIDISQTVSRLNNLVPGASNLFADIRHYSVSPLAVRIDGKWVAQEQSKKAHFPSLVITGVQDENLELEVFLQDALGYGKILLTQKSKINSLYSRKCEEQDARYWLSVLAEKRFEKLKLKVPLKKLIGSENSFIHFSGVDHPLKFDINPEYNNYLNSRGVGMKPYKGNKPVQWKVDSWFSEFQNTIQASDFMREFSKDQYDEIIKEANKEMAEECKTNPLKK